MLKPLPELIGEIRAGLRCLTAAEAMTEVRDNGGIVIDVREASEVTERPAPGSLNIPRGVLEMQASQRFTDADTRLYLHCASGARATLAAEQLERIGYTRVTVITCPIDEVCRVQSGQV